MTQVLSATQVTSDPFPSIDISLKSTFYVRLQGTVNGDWDIESALKDTDLTVAANWVTETGGIGFTSDDQVSSEFLVGEGLVYRINLGAGNQGPTGTVHETSLNNFR